MRRAIALHCYHADKFLPTKVTTSKKLHFQKVIDIYALKISFIEIATLITPNNFVTATGRTQVK